MSKKAAAFITHLSQDPKALETYMENPATAMEGHDLSKEDRKALGSRDPQKIREYLGDSYSPDLCMFFDDPDWPPWP